MSISECSQFITVKCDVLWQFSCSTDYCGLLQGFSEKNVHWWCSEQGLGVQSFCPDSQLEGEVEKQLKRYVQLSYRTIACWLTVDQTSSEWKWTVTSPGLDQEGRGPWAQILRWPSEYKHAHTDLHQLHLSPPQLCLSSSALSLLLSSLSPSQLCLSSSALSLSSSALSLLLSSVSLLLSSLSPQLSSSSVLESLASCCPVCRLSHNLIKVQVPDKLRLDDHQWQCTKALLCLRCWKFIFNSCHLRKQSFSLTVCDWQCQKDT